jgi:integration host factor subunit alpha
MIYTRIAGEMSMKKTLTKADIVEDIYEETDRNRADVRNIMEKLLEIMKGAIKKDRALLISGFGKFECYDKAARIGRNPQTDEAITLPPRRVVVFRLSRKFRAELNP